MSGLSFPRVPVNPRLEFGVPLKEVCEKGILHPGLKDLFLKAYLSASGDDHVGEKQFKGLSRIPCVLEALKAGPSGQGKLDDRISLKLKLESGKWIIAAQTPAGAPMWLLRHFLGCLPRPLLAGSHWRMIAVACGAASRPENSHQESDVLEKFVTALEALPRENYSVLVALVLLIRNLSAVVPTNDSNSVTLREEAVEGLSQFLTAAIISRPYRPGLNTVLDKQHKPLLVFLSGHWLEVEELCRDTGISRHHGTCESRYEFASLDGEVNHTERQAMATAEDPKSFARKLNQQPLKIPNPRISISHCAIDDTINNSRNKVWRPIDEPVTRNIKQSQVPDDSVIVQMPKGVYNVLSEKECTFSSIADEEATRKVMENSSDGVEFADVFGHGRIHLDVQKIRDSECFLLRKVPKDKTNKIPSFDLKKLISEHEDKVTVFTRMEQPLRCDALPPEKEVTGTVKVKVKVEMTGTQTFECEFPEESHSIEIAKLKERTDVVRLSSERVELLENSNTPQIPQENVTVLRFGSSDVFRSSKARDKKATIPLTKSTALLIKNFINDPDTFYFPSRKVTKSELAGFPDKKVIDEAEQAATSNEDVSTSKIDRDVRTLTNSFKDKDDLRDKKKNSNRNDFVTELKSNFEQGRRKPSDSKLSSRIVIADASEQDVAKRREQEFPQVVRAAQFLSEKETNVRELGESSSTQVLFPKTFCAPIPSANSM